MTAKIRLLEFGKQLSRLDADVAVIMARKAVCLVSCMQKQGLAYLSMPSVSDRVLAFDCPELRGKRVALIDDALITGTSLDATEERLKTFGATVTQRCVYCVNLDFWNPEFIQPDKPYAELSDEETTSFCASVVDALSVFPTPYAVDYPISQIRGLTEGALAQAVHAPGWRAFDVSSSRQSECGIRTITLVPDRFACHDFDRAVGWDVSDHARFRKIRLYIGPERPSAGKQIADVVAMPVVVLDPLKIEELDTLWLAADLPRTKATGAVQSRSAKLQVLQFALADRLFESWSRHVELSNDGPPPSLDMHLLRFIMPERVAEALRDDLRELGPLFSGAPTRVAATTVRPAGVQSTFQQCGPGYLDAALAEPFLDRFRNEELRARGLVKKYGREALKQPEYDGVLNRLNKGLGLPSLLAIADVVAPHSRTFEHVSLFLDRAIDRGVVVPITVESNGEILRAYRHGEDVEVTEIERRLACDTIEHFLSDSGRSHIPRTWAEKLLVLLIRLSVDHGMLNPWEGEYGHDGTIGVRFDLHGAVVRKGARRPYQRRTETFARLLTRVGYLHESSEGYKLARKPEHVPVQSRQVSYARTLGLILGRVEREKRLSLPDITLIATLYRPLDIIGALAAELSLASDFIEPVIRMNLPTEQKIKSIYASMRNTAEGRRFYDALNSGLWKYRKSIDGEPHKTIERIASDITDPLLRANWSSLWTMMPSHSRTAVPLDAEICLDGLACILVGWNILARVIIRHCADKPDTPKKKRKDNELLSGITECAQMLRQVQRRRPTLDGGVHPDRATDSDSPVLPGEVVEGIARTLDLLPELLDTVDAILPYYGRKIRIERHEHGLVVSPIGKGTDGDSFKDILDRAMMRLRAAIKEQPSTPAVFPEVLQSHANTTARVVLIRGRESVKWVARLVRYLLHPRHRAVIQVSVLLDLPRQHQAIVPALDGRYLGRGFHHLVALAGKLRRDEVGDGTAFVFTSLRAPSLTILTDELEAPGNTVCEVVDRLMDLADGDQPVVISLRIYELRTRLHSPNSPHSRPASQSESAQHTSDSSRQGEEIVKIQAQQEEWVPGRKFMASIAFVAIPQLTKDDPVRGYQAIWTLHQVIEESLKGVRGLRAFNSLTGAIVMAPDNSGAVLHRALKSLVAQIAAHDIPTRIGLTHGMVETFSDVDGSLSAIGEPVNIAARLANAHVEGDPEQSNEGCLVTREYADHAFAGANVHGDELGWLAPSHHDTRLKKVRGKRGETFEAIQAPAEFFATSPEHRYARLATGEVPEEFRRNACVAMAYDLPNFSDGSHHELRTRFMRVVDVVKDAFRKLVNPELLFSPGGDGGIIVLSGTDQDTAYQVATKLMEVLDIESTVMATKTGTSSRIGLHYGPVQVYRSADGSLRPTGPTLFIADEIAGDKEAREVKSTVFSSKFENSAASGNRDAFNSRFRWLTNLSSSTGMIVRRFVSRQA